MISAQTYNAIEKNFLFLYADAKRHKKQYQLFEHMLERIPFEKYSETKQMLIKIYSGYNKYLLKEIIKKNKSIWRKLIHKVKGIVGNK